MAAPTPRPPTPRSTHSRRVTCARAATTGDALRIACVEPSCDAAIPLPLPPRWGSDERGWSPDSQYLWTLAQERNGAPLLLFTVCADGRCVHEHATAPDPYERAASWSPDGRLVHRGLLGSSSTFELVADCRARDCARVSVSGGRPAFDSPLWSSDGTRYVFAAGDAMWAADAIGAPVRRIGAFGQPELFDASGRRVLYWSGGLRVARVDGSEDRSLDAQVSPAAQPSPYDVVVRSSAPRATRYHSVARYGAVTRIRGAVRAADARRPRNPPGSRLATGAAGWLVTCWIPRHVPITPPSDTGELTRVVDVSAKIQQLSRDAAQMRMQAINARIQTRTAQAAVPGFETVAIHMSELSQEIDASAHRLRGLTVEWVHAVSGLLGCRRERALLDEVDPVAAPHGIAAARARSDERRRMLGQRIERCRRAFLAELEATEQMSAMGRVLASSARIEAAYAGALADHLGATAGTFAQLAHDVHDSVRMLVGRARIRRELAS